MELRSKDELHLQQVINNLRYNLLQFNHRIADTILHESPQLNLTSKSNLMNGVGILSLKTIELQKAWEEVNFALKRAGVLWPSQFTVVFPQKHKYTSGGYEKEEPHPPSEEEEGYQEPKHKRGKKPKGETTCKVRKNKSSSPTTSTDAEIPTQSSQSQTTTTVVSSQTP